MLYAIVCVLLLIVDQGIKYWTTLNLELNTGVKELIPGLIRLRNLHNTGSAFNLLQSWNGARWLFLIVTVLFAVLVIVVLAKGYIRGELGRWSALVVLAGALGNGIDRCLYGYVVDMFEFSFFPSFPVFNFADICITVFGILFCLYILLTKEPFGVEVGAVMRSGPGGSVTTKPAPKPKTAPEPKAKPEQTPVAMAKPEPAPESRDMPAYVAEPEEAPVREVTERPAGGRRIAEKEHRAPRRSEAKPAREKKAEKDSPYARFSRPVAEHESFLEMTKLRPGEDPFTEWMQKENTPREVTPVPVQPAAAEPEQDADVKLYPAAKPAQPVAEPVKPEPAAEPEPVRVAEPEPVKPEAPAPRVEAPAAEPQYSLEDILNEFRDL